MSQQRFPKSYRVVSSADFTRILRKGICAADATLVLHAIVSTQSCSPRLGVTIPKKTGVAVVRNQWKRWIREAFRTQRDQLPTGFDFVVRPKRDAKPSYDEIKSSLRRLAHKAIRRSEA